jgi:hypothetical protein
VVNLVRLARSRLRSAARTTGTVLGSLLLLGVAVIAVVDLALSEHRPCRDYGGEVPPPSGGLGCGDSVTAPWPIAAVLAVLGLASLGAVWLNRRRGAVVDELLAD